jgi:vacuolar-type H+-ATPase subunit H
MVTSMALNRGSIENMVGAARRAREEIANAVAAAEMRIRDIDPGLREEIARERRGLVRAEARSKVERRWPAPARSG